MPCVVGKQSTQQLAGFTLTYLQYCIIVCGSSAYCLLGLFTACTGCIPLPYKDW